MDILFNIVTQYFWLIMIGYMLLVGVMWWRHSRALREKDPAFSTSYKRLITWFVTAGSIPWLFLGVAQMVGEYNYVYEIFDYWNADFWTAGFYTSSVILGLAANYYIFVKDGAKELSKHPGLFNQDHSSAGWKLEGIAIPFTHLCFFVLAYMMRDQLASLGS
ncbi:hypothetical protein [Hyphococcus sp.]|uniref:hypothetical protein n=1 Tax=Hyphococcus sp. TaxID=2038636 RepID=UPI0035C78591